MSIYPFKKLNVSYHFLVSAGLFVLICLPLTWPVSLPVQFWIKQCFSYLLWIGLFYLGINILVPRLLFRDRGGYFTLAILVALIAVVMISLQLDQWLNLPALLSRIAGNHHQETYQGKAVGILGVIVIALIVLGLSIVIAIAQKIQTDRFREQALEKEKIRAELSFLKTQINPHFFFNVLHTIYALIDTDTGKARESVYTLSHMMRYVLYDTQHETTSLEKEVAFVEDYIQLMQLRLTSRVQVIFQKPHDLREMLIAPMIFLPFIENAFKHGISNTLPSYIYVGIRQPENSLEIEVRNSIFQEKIADHLEESTGIGLVNTQRRLDLVYPGKHELITSRNNKSNEFTVQLKINIS